MSTETYKARVRSAHDAIDLVQDGDAIVLPSSVGEPVAFLTALSDRRRELSGVTVGQILPLTGYDYLDPETAQHVRHSAYFLGPSTRPGAQQGWSHVVPQNFSEMPALIRQGLIPADVVVTRASLPDENGCFSLGLAPDYTMAAIESARVVILEVNPNVPYCFGDNLVPLERVTAIVEDDAPLATVGLPTIGEVQQAIGRHVAELIPDGATVQIGYGAIPDAVVMQLTDRKDLGVHTEMIGDGILTLLDSGAITNARKNVNPGVMPATFALGSERLYRWMDRNPALRMEPVDVTNDPYLAGQNDLLHTINATMQVDLVGQCNSESMGPVPYSGTGGQSDFVRAANRSRGGKSFIVMPSTAKGGTISRIVPALTPGAHVTTSKNDVNYVVTEYGVAQLRGKDNAARAAALIAIAHPDFRAELTEDAARRGLL